MITAITRSADETRALAAEVAAIVGPGDVVLLEGDLGAGKTTFAQGFGLALGVTEPVTSPTFTLVRPYEGRLTLHHVDLYRLEEQAEVADLGLSELVDGDAVALVEWGERAVGVVAADFLEIRIEAADRDDEREWSFTPVGLRWTERIVPLRAALERWT